MGQAAAIWVAGIAGHVYIAYRRPGQMKGYTELCAEPGTKGRCQRG